MSEGNDQNLIDFIAATVEVMRDQLGSVATKEDVSRLEARVAEVESSVHRVESDVALVKDRTATKADIAQVEARLEAKITAVQEQMAQMATKNELNAKTTAIRGDIERVQLRLDSIDHALSGRMSLMEGQISRLRSVVYLLVKDQPDILTLLGQPHPGENRPQG